MRIATFNLQNLRLRLREGEPVLDGAADQDEWEAPRPADLAHADRMETARVIAEAKADVVALQEVFDLAALDFLHDQYLMKAGSPAYPYRYCLKGNDGRGLNVAALSRQRPLSVKSHAALTGADFGLSDLSPDLRDHPLFRRDCLALEFDTVTLFICHFKAPYPDLAKAQIVREAEARAVRTIVETSFADPSQERWIILGDFNEPARMDATSGSALDPLKTGLAVDLLDRLTPGTDWTYAVPESHLHSRPDRIFVSPRLAEEYPGIRPQIIRSGMEAIQRVSGSALSSGPSSAPHASDHALVYADFQGL